MICRHCGKKVDGKMKYCSECGHSLDESDKRKQQSLEGPTDELEDAPHIETTAISRSPRIKVIGTAFKDPYTEV